MLFICYQHNKTYEQNKQNIIIMYNRQDKISKTSKQQQCYKIATKQNKKKSERNCLSLHVDYITRHH